jgi:hypothetical protein
VIKTKKKIFQFFSNHGRNINIIWEMIKSEGNKVRGFKELEDLGFQHFKEHIGTNIVERLKVIPFFPGWVTDDDNERMFRPITKEDLHHVITNFKKNGSPSPYGWTIESYLYFFELLDGDLLQGVEEVRI